MLFVMPSSPSIAEDLPARAVRVLRIMEVVADSWIAMLWAVGGWAR